MEQNKALCDIEHKDYAEILQHAVAVIEHARIETAKHVNINVASAYWEIGKLLHERKIESGHGDRVVKRLSEDLKERYPKMGVSPRQLWNMKKFFQRYDGHDEKVLRSVALLPWSHNLLLLSKVWQREQSGYAFLPSWLALPCGYRPKRKKINEGYAEDRLLPKPSSTSPKVVEQVNQDIFSCGHHNGLP